jgi:hypothetical protein
MGPQPGKETWDGLLEDLSSTVRLPVLDVPAAGTLRADTHDPLDDSTLPNIPVLAVSAVEERAALDAQVGALERQVGELSRKVERLAQTVAERDAALDDLRLEHSRLETELEDARHIGEDLDGMRRAAEGRATELEADLRAAEAQIHRLESELRLRAARPEPPPPEPAEPPLLQPVLPSEPPQAVAPQDGIARYLVLTEGDAEVVHMLGRRTTIGRGPDNDLRIDTKFISRHHAVIVVAPAQTLLEDLRSTNGIMVNGRRVTRAVLRDGDVVHIGKTRFRYVQRVRDRG